MAAMETFVAKHAAKIRGTLSCFDRVLFRGYLPLMSGWAPAGTRHHFASEELERAGTDAIPCGHRILSCAPYALECAHKHERQR
jgi:hypothetical protein